MWLSSFALAKRGGIHSTERYSDFTRSSVTPSASRALTSSEYTLTEPANTKATPAKNETLTVLLTILIIKIIFLFITQLMLESF